MPKFFSNFLIFFFQILLHASYSRIERWGSGNWAVVRRGGPAHSGGPLEDKVQPRAQPPCSDHRGIPPAHHGGHRLLPLGLLQTGNLPRRSAPALQIPHSGQWFHGHPIDRRQKRGRLHRAQIHARHRFPRSFRRRAAPYRGGHQMERFLLARHRQSGETVPAHRIRHSVPGNHVFRESRRVGVRWGTGGVGGERGATKEAAEVNGKMVICVHEIACSSQHFFYRGLGSENSDWFFLGWGVFSCLLNG